MTGADVGHVRHEKQQEGKEESKNVHYIEGHTQEYWAGTRAVNADEWL